MGDFDALTALVQVVFVNVVLSADNAVVIGIASVGLPAHQRLRALWLGIGLALEKLKSAYLVILMLLRLR